MSETVVVFSTRSESEARIVSGLLDTHGIPSVWSSDIPHTVFPMGEVRLRVPAHMAGAAKAIIESHRADEGGGRLVSLRDEFVTLEQRLGHRFRDRGLLEHALTHRSRAHEDVTGGVADNESMEFLGDAVLGLVIADLLYREHPELDEGDKSKLKAALVSASTLARVGNALHLGDYLLLGRGEEKTGGRRKQALIANTCEALIAAIYLDAGIDAAAAFIRREFAGPLAEARDRRALLGTNGDFKSALQEALQARDRPLPEYRTVAERGPDHEKFFKVELWVGGELLAHAEGRSKKEAEQEAAYVALAGLLSRSR